MGDQLSTRSDTAPTQLNGGVAVIAEDQATVNIDQGKTDTEMEAQKEYEEQIKQFKIVLQDYRKEALDVFHKSQETFEKQLSYISAGALSLSIGFIQSIVKPISTSSHKWMLVSGWVALIFTLLLNLMSHFVAGWAAKKGAAEAANFEAYDANKIGRRANWITGMNIATVITLVAGIVFVVLYIILNVVYVKQDK